jgi:hypothetical protein
MFDISTLNKRYFNIKINGLELEVEPPKLKVLKKIMALSKTKSAESIDELSEAVGLILSKNKTGYKVPDDVIDELDLDQMFEIITEYFKWLGEARNSKN